MSFLPLTPEEEQSMLKIIGVRHVDDLFASIPPKIREGSDSIKIDLEGEFGKIENGLSEHELRRYFHTLASKNASHQPHFLGGGVYDNIIPSIVNQLVLRGEFLTCYTPYQPEISQGTLQAIFEFQTMMCRITGMEVSNASLYDGATATAEAVLMAQRISGKDPILMADSVHPEYRAVCRTFLRGHSALPISLPWTTDGTVDLKALVHLVKAHDPAGVVIAWPNYFGIIEPLDEIRRLLPKECLLIVSNPDISALSIFDPPGSHGADVVAGEAHQLGTPMLFGGPHVGYFAAKREYLRQMPGRLAGESVDCHGKRAYALTLSTREQHIRREKATSNICTNQGLIALRTAIYLSFLGKEGFRNLGTTNFSLFDYLKNQLAEHGIQLKFPKGTHYREGVFEVPSARSRIQKVIAAGIIPGISMHSKMDIRSDEFANSLLICTHPKLTKKNIDQLVELITHD